MKRLRLWCVLAFAAGVMVGCVDAPAQGIATSTGKVAIVGFVGVYRVIDSAQRVVCYTYSDRAISCLPMEGAQ